MKILVIDDHLLIREALHGVLTELRDDAIVLDASDSQQAMRCVTATADLDLILLDLKLPDGSGFDLLVELRDRFPAVAVVVLSASNRRDDITRALELGALGFIPKSAQREVMLAALELIFSGAIYVPPEILGDPSTLQNPLPQAGRTSPSTIAELTDRQRDVLALMMQGMSNKAICRTLGIAEPTVKNHVTAVLKAFGASNRTEAVIAASAQVHGPAAADPVSDPTID